MCHDLLHHRKPLPFPFFSKSTLIRLQNENTFLRNATRGIQEMYPLFEFAMSNFLASSDYGIGVFNLTLRDLSPKSRAQFGVTTSACTFEGQVIPKERRCGKCFSTSKASSSSRPERAWRCST